MTTTGCIPFLNDVAPFNLLPEKELERVAAKISTARYPKDTILFVQGKSVVDQLHVVREGSVEQYFGENGQKTLHQTLGPGDLYGGISMLLNSCVCLRTVRVLEDVVLCRLPRAVFFELVQKYPEFSDYFTDTFGRRMLDREYRFVVAKTARAEEESNPLFFNQTVGSLCKEPPLSCPLEKSVREAAQVMERNDSSAMLLQSVDGQYVGVVTDNDLREKVVAGNVGYDRPVSEIMTWPLQSISDQAMVFEAVLLMDRKGIKHLVVTDSLGQIEGLVSDQDLLLAQSDSPVFLLNEIREARRLENVFDKFEQLPRLFNAMISSGAKSESLNGMITSFADAILKRLVEFALDECGPPPVRFAFMIMGSEGRGEQTFKTDQDNAIVFEDVPEESEAEVKEYFLNFARKVCGWLDKAGYAYCEGGVMAQNPQWCQPLAKWKEYFSEWILHAQPEALLQASIFFDFRCGYGDEGLIYQLHRHLFAKLTGWVGFFRHLTENALEFKPPIGVFRNFVLESKGEHRDTLDIKSAMTPVVDFARIFALKNGIQETNTLRRLNLIFRKGVISEKEYQEIVQAYSFMMRLRLLHQVRQVMEAGRKPDNYLNPKSLTRIEQQMLKEVFKRVENFQGKLSAEFTGHGFVLE